MMLKNQNKTYIIMLGFVVAGIVLLAVFSYGTFNSIKHTSAKIALVKKQASSMQLEDNIINDFKSKYSSYEADLKQIDRLFVDSGNPVEFITFLEGISSDVNVVSDIAIAPRNGVNKEGVVNNSIAFQIYVYGSFSNILKFSERLEAGPYLARISNFSLKKSEIDQTDKKNIQHDLEAYIFVEALPK